MKNSQPFMSACFKMLIRVAKQKTLDMAERNDLYNNCKRNLETQTAVEETTKKQSSCRKYKYLGLSMETVISFQVVDVPEFVPWQRPSDIQNLRTDSYPQVR